MKMRWNLMVVALALFGLAGIGCDQKTATPTKSEKSEKSEKSDPKPATTKPSEEAKDEVQAERSKLSPEDLALVKAQEWCVISDDERLGSMGAPIKLDIKGQAVFVCCKGCKATALANPDKTLAKLAELKTKAAAQQKK